MKKIIMTVLLGVAFLVTNLQVANAVEWTSSEIGEWFVEQSQAGLDRTAIYQDYLTAINQFEFFDTTSDQTVGTTLEEVQANFVPTGDNVTIDQYTYEGGSTELKYLYHDGDLQLWFFFVDNKLAYIGAADYTVVLDTENALDDADAFKKLVGRGTKESDLIKVNPVNFGVGIAKYKDEMLEVVSTVREVLGENVLVDFMTFDRTELVNSHPVYAENMTDQQQEVMYFSLFNYAKNAAFSERGQNPADTGFQIIHESSAEAGEDTTQSE